MDKLTGVTIAIIVAVAVLLVVITLLWIYYGKGSETLSSLWDTVTSWMGKLK